MERNINSAQQSLISSSIISAAVTTDNGGDDSQLTLSYNGSSITIDDDDQNDQEGDIPPIKTLQVFFKVFWKELKKTMYLAAPATFMRTCQYSLGAITITLSGHLGTLDLAAFSVENSVIAGFSLGFLLSVQSQVNMTIHYLNEIKGDRGTWRIKAKITHMWEFLEQGVVSSIHMILMDAKGNKIMASMGKAAFPKYSKLCKIGESYFFTMFGVGLLGGDYRPTTHEWKIFFYKTTIIQKIPDITITGSDFTFVSFEDILQAKHDARFLLDVIGEVITYRDYDEVKKTINLDLMDANGFTLGVRLWDNYAESVYTHIKNTENDEKTKFILVIQYAKMKSWGGVSYVQNCLGTTSKIYINPDIPEPIFKSLFIRYLIFY